MPNRTLRRCDCGASLLASDFIGRSASRLDQALAHHRGGTTSPCQAAGAIVKENSIEQLKTALQDGLAVPWQDEEPPLTYCSRHSLHELAEQLLLSGAAADHLNPAGLAALHFAAMRNDALLVTALLGAGASALLTTQDGATGGGQIALHLAAANGATAAACLLLEAQPSSAAVVDWDGRLPATSALHAGHRVLALQLADAAAVAQAALFGIGHEESAEVDELIADVKRDTATAASAAAAISASNNTAATATNTAAAAASKAAEHSPPQLQPSPPQLQPSPQPQPSPQYQHQHQLCRLGLVERERDRLCIAGREALRGAHLLRGLLSPTECDWLLGELSEAGSMHGWHHGRHKHYATEDMPLWRAPSAACFVRRLVHERVFPCMSSAFGIPLSDLRLQEIFAVRYEAAGQPSLSYHRDDTLLSFNVSLTDEYLGGGTCFAAPVELREWADGGANLLRQNAAAQAHDDAAGGAAHGAAATTITAVGGSVRGARGDCLLHCGQLLHGGGAVSAGIRMIVVGFVSELVHN